MPESTNRRNFLMGGAAALAATTLAANATAQTTPAHLPASPIRLGVASYSFNQFQRHLAIVYTKQLKTTLISVKDFHLAMGTPEEIKRGAAEFTRAGLTMTGAGTIYLDKDDDDMRRKFEYVKTAGIPMIVGSARPADIERVEKFVKEFDIKVALHNHGPEDTHGLPSPFEVLKAIEGRDPRLGLCIDVGHTTRAGADVIAAIHAAGPKLFDMHIKDLADLKVSSSQVPVGDGLMPVPEIFRALIDIKFPGQVMLEYEINSEDPMPGMQRSFAYMRGVLAGMGYKG